IIHVTHDLNEALVLGDDILSIVLGKMAPDWFQHQLKEVWKDEFPRNAVFNKTF
ncbi:MAG: hypothetical protein JRJ82_08015, partial [Deltaproteobacteria bacterium]|nr:hypothetical protein [Deltaproteobacteria bacterium]